MQDMVCLHILQLQSVQTSSAMKHLVQHHLSLGRQFTHFILVSSTNSLPLVGAQSAAIAIPIGFHGEVHRSIWKNGSSKKCWYLWNPNPEMTKFRFSIRPHCSSCQPTVWPPPPAKIRFPFLRLCKQMLACLHACMHSWKQYAHAIMSWELHNAHGLSSFLRG